MRARVAGVVVVVALLCVGLGVLLRRGSDGQARPQAPHASCDRFASPGGRDAARGTQRAPFRTPARLLRSLEPGQTGCLAHGRYAIGEQLRFPRGGTPGRPIRLTSLPGGPATLTGGRVYVPPGAPHVVLEGLHIDAARAHDVSIWVAADDVRLERNEISNDGRAGSCVFLGRGEPGAPPVQRTVIRRNRIHDCGSNRTGDGRHDHGIYVAASRGAQIEENVIYAAPGWGVQLYPNVTGARIVHNVIDDVGRGIIFGGGEGTTSNDNLVARNIISNAYAEYLIQSYWDGAVGTGNVARDNCIFGGRLGTVAGNGFASIDNSYADPGYVDRRGRDYRLTEGSPCRIVVGFDAAARAA